MPAKYAKHFNPTATPQTQPMRADQVANSAGGFSWAVDDWVRLDRFVTLGTEGGTFYANEKKITRENATVIVSLIKSDGVRVVERVAELSDAGRAYKNDAALFVLALAFAEGDTAAKKAAEVALPNIARIGTHLFTLLEYVDGMRGWGRSLRRAVANWYQGKELSDLAYQVAKYQQRNGWSHRDALRLSHPKTADESRNWLYKYVVGKVQDMTDAPAFIAACEQAKVEKDVKTLAALVRSHNLPREVVNTELLNDAAVWEALLEKMPMTAMVRNLATLTRAGVIAPMGKWTAEIAARLTDKGRLKKARIHPIQLLAALLTYSSGQGARGSNEWTPVAQITDALDKAFYLSFDAVEPTGKRIVLALDVSGSMGWSTIAGVPGLTPAKGSAALALVTAATEPNHVITTFSHTMQPVSISPRQRLDDVVGVLGRIPMGGTNASLPMLWALQNKVQADAFVILTDSETWAGNIHPAQALARYRAQMQIPAKLIVVGMVSNGFTVADPNDAGMLTLSETSLKRRQRSNPEPPFQLPAHTL
jgi:60 kDa SS-A/Ro ribonucleoprotein